MITSRVVQEYMIRGEDMSFSMDLLWPCFSPSIPRYRVKKKTSKTCEIMIIAWRVGSLLASCVMIFLLPLSPAHHRHRQGLGLSTTEDKTALDTTKSDTRSVDKWTKSGFMSFLALLFCCLTINVDLYVINIY